MTLFRVNFHYHLVMQFKAPKQPAGLNSEIHDDTLVAGFEDTHCTVSKNLQQAEDSHK
jgi:hypothetical protein